MEPVTNAEWIVYGVGLFVLIPSLLIALGIAKGDRRHDRKRY